MPAPTSWRRIMKSPPPDCTSQSIVPAPTTNPSSSANRKRMTDIVSSSAFGRERPRERFLHLPAARRQPRAQPPVVPPQPRPHLAAAATAGTLLGDVEQRIEQRPARV